MYLSHLQIWNFRKISTSNGSPEILPDNPGLNVVFNPNLNVIVGENDSGKTAIIDALRFLLGTRSMEYHRLDERDFYSDNEGRRTELRIECLFSGFSHIEAGSFLECIHFNDENEYELRVWLHAYIRDQKVIYYTRAGIDEEGTFIDGEARELLRLTYLKPLRDAEAELSPGYRSRLAQILSNEPLFKNKFDENQQRVKHALEKYVGKANILVRDYFSKNILEASDEFEISAGTPGGGPIKEKIQESLNEFFHSEDPQNPEFHISGSELSSILRKLGLELEENRSGLGALNQLFIAVELLLLQGADHRGLKMVLVEELEAHLHPQAQLRVISALQEKQQQFNSQFILTTHSTTLASKIKLENLIICHEGKTYPMGHNYTGLEHDDYEFLERFLDATKANLFFAKGVIIVEGDSENILIPTIADLIGRPLHKYGVSIVNVGSKALLRYAKIFTRNPDHKDRTLPIKVAVITDLDIQQVESEEGEIQSKRRGKDSIIPNIEDESIELKEEFNSGDSRIKVFHSPLWTMEYDIASGELARLMNQATMIARLSQSRTKNGVFSGLTEEEVKERIDKADEKYNGWIRDGVSDERIGYSIYERLQNGTASKTVTAQWFARLLNENRDEVVPILLRDTKIKYIVDAIYHVTKPDD